MTAKPGSVTALIGGSCSGIGAPLASGARNAQTRPGQRVEAGHREPDGDLVAIMDKREPDPAHQFVHRGLHQRVAPVDHAPDHRAGSCMHRIIEWAPDRTAERGDAGSGPGAPRRASRSIRSTAPPPRTPRGGSPQEGGCLTALLWNCSGTALLRQFRGGGSRSSPDGHLTISEDADTSHQTPLAPPATRTPPRPPPRRGAAAPAWAG